MCARSSARSSALTWSFSSILSSERGSSSITFAHSSSDTSWIAQRTKPGICLSFVRLGLTRYRYIFWTVIWILCFTLVTMCFFVFWKMPFVRSPNL